MHILLTDRLECPRCGDGFGLVLFAADLRDRRVIEGSLGCANCRETYPVSRGLADLRPTPRGELPESPELQPAEEEVVTRMGAFLGITGGPATVAILGPSAASAEALAALVPDLEVVAVLPGVDEGEEREGVSRLLVSERLPFRTSSLAGAVMEGELAADRVIEVLRSLRVGSRVVVLDPPSGMAERLEAAGLDLLVSARSAVVGTVKSSVSA